MNIEAAIYARLSGDATLVDLLGSYQSLPCIFVEAPIPDDAPMPWVVVNHVSDVPLDTLGEYGRQVTKDFACYTARSGSITGLRTIVERVRALLHDQPLTVTGYENFISTAAGVGAAPTDRTVSGRIISVRFSLRKLPA